jgi:phloroglucinol synthase
MPILRKPDVYYPEHILKADDVISYIEKYHAGTPLLETAKSMINHTTIEQRHSFMPFSEIMKESGFGCRQEMYETFAKDCVVNVARNAMANASVSNNDISMVMVISCTGFMMPSLTAYLINELDLPENTTQMPIAQMGCVGGAYAVNRAYEHCLLSRSNNALIICVEIASLCFHKDANKLEDFLADAIFADGVSGCVMRGDDSGEGFLIESTKSLFLKRTESYIQYKMMDEGFLFSLNKEVMYSIDMIKDSVVSYIDSTLGDNRIEYCISHTGGRRILDEVSRCFNIPNNLLDKSRESLRLVGNTSSVSVIDVFNRHFGTLENGSKGILMAFGPGFSAELTIGEWQT